MSQPLQDTWNFKQEVGFWGMNIPLDSTVVSTQDINLWFANSLIKTLNAFSNLARAREIVIEPKEQTQKVGEVFIWKENILYNEYLNDTLQIIREYPLIIQEIEISLDMFVYVRTKKSPNNPVRKWVNNLGEIVIFYSLDELEQSGIYLNIDHTLFLQFSKIKEEDNTELFNINQPFLKNALQSWEKEFVSITEFDGVGTIYKYGFRSESK